MSKTGTRDDVSRCPLTWPIGWPRKQRHQRTHARFGRAESVQYGTGTGSYQQRKRLTISDALDRLMTETDRLRAQHVVVSTNVPTRRDGMPYSSAREPDDPGVAVYFRLKGRDQVLACDTWDRVADNIAAIAAHISAIRAVERYGVGTLDQAFAGYQGLPARGETWRSTLGFKPDDEVTREIVMERFRARARAVHPDVAGGSHEAMTALTEAKAGALRACEAAQ